MATKMTLVTRFRQILYSRLGLRSPGGIWRVLAVILALINLKNLPFVWHIRLFRAIYYHLYLQPTPLPTGSLFKPLITSSRSPLWEVDYNLHKSNSTYFSDVDIARTHLVTAILRKGILRANRRGKGSWKSNTGAEATPSTGKADKYLVALGGVACVFRKEIKPYERYEIWTRLLCWDRKWLYIVSHLVRPGTFRPTSHALQPWKTKKALEAKHFTLEERREKLLKGVFATSIAKYVIKKGRLTVPAEQVLQNSDLLPEKPEGAAGASHLSVGSMDSPVTEADVLEDSAFCCGGGEWTWERVESQRKKGLRYAQMFAGLDGLHEVFDGGEFGCLGEFSDMLLWP